MGQLKENLQAIKAEKEKIKAENLPQSVTVFGITGTIMEFSGKEKQYIVESNETYVTEEAEGNNVELLAPQNAIPGKALLDNAFVGLKMTKQHLAEGIHLDSNNIRKGTTILGITGTCEPYVDPTTTQDYQDCLLLTQQILGTEVNS